MRAAGRRSAGLLDGTQAYVLTVIEHAARRIRIPAVSLHPTGQRTSQQARNLSMHLGEQTNRVKLKQFRAVATRYDKRDFMYQATIDVASIRIWLRDPVS